MLLYNKGKAKIITKEGSVKVGDSIEVSEELGAKLLKMYPKALTDTQAKVSVNLSSQIAEQRAIIEKITKEREKEAQTIEDLKKQIEAKAKAEAKAEINEAKAEDEAKGSKKSK